LPHHLGKEYTPIAVGVPACSGKMNNIVKNYKDYCMDIICRNPYDYRALAGWCMKKGGVSGVTGQREVARSSKVVVWFSQPDGQEQYGRTWKKPKFYRLCTKTKSAIIYNMK